MSGTELLAARIDTLGFSGLDEAALRARFATRPGMELWDGGDSFIRYRRAGLEPGADVPSLFILPDGPATIESYDAFIDALGDRFAIVIAEIPGFGYSYARKAEALRFEDSAAILARLVEELALPNCVLVGPCVQGLIAMRMAELAGDGVAGLIVAQTGDFEQQRVWGAERLDAAGVLRKPFAGQVMFREGRIPAAVDWWLGFCGGKRTPPALKDTAREVFSGDACYALASQMQLWLAGDSPGLPQPACPAAVIWGLADKSHRHTDKRSIVAGLPDAAYTEREDLAHFPDLEDPELISQTALALLGRTN